MRCTFVGEKGKSEPTKIRWVPTLTIQFFVSLVPRLSYTLSCRVCMCVQRIRIPCKALLYPISNTQLLPPPSYAFLTFSNSKGPS